MYAVWVKLDETLPWIELKGDYPNREEARKAAKQILKSAKIKIVKVANKKKPLKVPAIANLR
ncbi:MAG: hypothetical protein ACPL0C_01290 [Candidatus Bathyarchaeales archaeon]